MAQITIADLVTALTEEAAVAVFLGLLKLGKFPTDSWADDSVPKTLVRYFCKFFADNMTLIAKITRGGYLDEAEKDFLTILASGFYKQTRKPAVFTRGKLKITDEGNTGPHVYASRTVYARTLSNRRFVNVDPINVSAGGFQENIVFEAENPGADWNVPPDSIVELVTTIVGAKVTNPGDWITQVGANEEDDASLRVRCKARFPELGGGATNLVYQGWALGASAEVRRARVYAGDPKDGMVRIVLAGQTGAVSGGAVTAVNDFIAPRVPLTAKPAAESATTQSVVIDATLYVDPAYLTLAPGYATEQMTALQNSLDIGGTLYRAQIIENLMSVPGAITTTLRLPEADVQPGKTVILTITPAVVVAKAA